MDVLEMFPVATNRIRPRDPCAKLILGAEIECGAFMSATNQLFGEGAARTAGVLWAEELEAGPNDFRSHDSDWWIVTISAANRLADLKDATRSTEKTCCGEGERQRLRKALEKYLDDVRPSKFRLLSKREERMV
jgi:hypothetical protein